LPLVVVLISALISSVAVAECVVFGVPRWNVDEMALIVAHVAADRPSIKDELKQFLVQKLPGGRCRASGGLWNPSAATAPANLPAPNGGATSSKTARNRAWRFSKKFQMQDDSFSGTKAVLFDHSTKAGTFFK
jgi:hypothetical protein